MLKTNHSGIVFIAVAVFSLFLTGCASSVQPTQQALPVSQTQAAAGNYSGPRSEIVVGDFNNRSSFMRGIFSDGEDRLGNQAKTILITHLQQTNRFILLDRGNMEAARREAEILGATQDIIGASFIVTGDVTEFGRREATDTQLFGLLGRGGTQTAYAVVSLYVVDIRTSAIIFSAQGAGEVALNERQVLGFGTQAGYDSTLNGQVLDLAIREAIDRLAEGIDAGRWNP
ncbi:MAG: CsgG/HfaB family protein [Treponema sp.]|nr:CsgG/HfaB family protein [Treponema sp.]